MATGKIINSLKVESTDFSKILKIDSNGNPSYVTEKYVAILEETQTNGLYCSGEASADNSSNWWLNTKTGYDNDSYTETIYATGTVDKTFRLFKRNLNTTILDEGSLIEDLTDKNFRLTAGTYRIHGWTISSDQNNSVVRLKQGTGYGTAILSIPSQGIPDSKAGLVHFDFVITVSGSASNRTFSIESGGTEYNNSADFGAPYMVSPSDEVYSRVYIENLT